MTAALVVYVIGVAVGLGVMPDPWPTRVGTALVWPLGPVAFLMVLAILLVTAVLLWPALALAAAALAGAGAWLLF